MSDRDRINTCDNERTLVVVPDANVLIHGKALSELPWGELERQKIEVLLVAPVIRELDKLKTQTGRPNKIARQLSSDVRGMLSLPDKSALVHASSPRVTKRVDIRTITTARHEALRLDHADQALINYALHIQAEGQDVLLLTDDTICGSTAGEFGLPVKFLPSEWQRDPEPDEATKENSKLKAEIKRLREAEPVVKLDFCDDAGASIKGVDAQIKHWDALGTEEIDLLMEEVQRCCPAATSFERPEDSTPNTIHGLLSGMDGIMRRMTNPWVVYEPATEKEIERYRTRDYPEWLSVIRQALGSLHEELNARTQWPMVQVVAANIGTRPATSVLLQLHAKGKFALLDADTEGSDDDDETDGDQKANHIKCYELPLPPEPPRGKERSINSLGDIQRQFFGSHLESLKPLKFPLLNSVLNERSDAFYWRKGRGEWGKQIELVCSSWRHGQQGVGFKLKIKPDERVDISGAIAVEVHAHNMTDPLSAHLPIRISFVHGSTKDEARSLVKALAVSADFHGRI